MFKKYDIRAKAILADMTLEEIFVKLTAKDKEDE